MNTFECLNLLLKLIDILRENILREDQSGETLWRSVGQVQLPGNTTLCWPPWTTCTHVVTTLFNRHITVITCWQVETGISTIVNMLVLSIQKFPVPATMNNLVASSLLNNIDGSTMLLTHDNNGVQTLFKQHPATTCAMENRLTWILTNGKSFKCIWKVRNGELRTFFFLPQIPCGWSCTYYHG